MQKKFITWYYAATKKSDFFLILAAAAHLFFLVYFDFFLKDKNAFLYSSLILAAAIFGIFGLKTVISIFIDDHKKFVAQNDQD